MKLAEMIYKMTKNFPKEEIYGMTSQVRRAAVSVPVNVAEGKGRFHTKVFSQFLYQAGGSLYEVLSLIKLAQNLDYLSEKMLTRC